MGFWESIDRVKKGAFERARAKERPRRVRFSVWGSTVESLRTNTSLHFTVDDRLGPVTSHGVPSLRTLQTK
jgi:hypothetical protein